MGRLLTSESVTGGHPDKICDQISDAVLDAILAVDPVARVAVEAAAKGNDVWVFGEVTTTAQVDYEAIARSVVEEWSVPTGPLNVRVTVSEQSPDIAIGVNQKADRYDSGAGDQGLMIGYATSDTPDFMPLPINLARDLTQALTRNRLNGAMPWLRPDGKAQVSVRYDRAGWPFEIEAVVVSAQHAEDITIEEVRGWLRSMALTVLPEPMLTEETRYHFNPTGRFVMGGPQADAGLTGRKIIVDTYGGAARHGGGAFSGKDPSKVDRSGAYAARWIAKNIVAGGLARKAEVELAYAIGVAEPVAVNIETFGTGVLTQHELELRVRLAVDLRPAALIERLGLRSTTYRPCAEGGHIGRSDLELPWEDLTLAERLGW